MRAVSMIEVKGGTLGVSRASTAYFVTLIEDCICSSRGVAGPMACCYVQPRHGSCAQLAQSD